MQQSIRKQTKRQYENKVINTSHEKQGITLSLYIMHHLSCMHQKHVNEKQRSTKKEEAYALFAINAVGLHKRASHNK